VSLSENVSELVVTYEHAIKLMSFGLFLGLKRKRMQTMGERWAARSAATKTVTATPQSVGLCEFSPVEMLHHTELMYVTHRRLSQLFVMSHTSQNRNRLFKKLTCF